MGETEEPQVKSIREFLREGMEAHGFTVEEHNEWIAPNGDLPAIRGLWHEPQVPGETPGFLEVDVLLPDRRAITETRATPFAGDEGVKDLLKGFVLGTFHVLLATLWDRVDPDLVTIHDWNVGGRERRVYLGGCELRAADEELPEVPEDLFPSIRDLLAAEALDGRVHWVRLFLGNVADRRTHEALLDNEAWTAGEEAMKRVAWPDRETFYSIRAFFMIGAVSAESGA